jgi:hypothetical protein
MEAGQRRRVNSMLAWGHLFSNTAAACKGKSDGQGSAQNQVDDPLPQKRKPSTAAIRFGPGSALITSSPGLFPRTSPPATSGLARETYRKHGMQKSAAPPPSRHHNSTPTMQALLPVWQITRDARTAQGRVPWDKRALWRQSSWPSNVGRLKLNGTVPKISCYTLS